VKILLVIVGMALVTYIPRLLPALFLDRFQFPDWFRKWLQSIVPPEPAYYPGNDRIDLDRDPAAVFLSLILFW